jgi:hypothetical protein
MPSPANINRTADKIFFNCQPSSAIQYVGYIDKMTMSDNNIGYSLNIMTNNLSTKEDKFINLLKQDVEHYPFMKTNSFHEITKKVKLILNNLHGLNPDSINIEPTYDGSILFSLTKGNINLYLEYFIDNHKYDMDECIINGFKNKNRFFDFSGSLDDSYFECWKIFNSLTTDDDPKANLNVDNLSFDIAPESELQIYQLQSA